MTYREKYGIEIAPAGPGEVALHEPDGHVAAVVPGDWSEAQIEAFLDGLKEGEAKGEEILANMLRTLIGAQKRIG